MKFYITIFTLILVSIWSLSSQAADEKKVEKKIWVQKQEKKAGLGVMVTSPDKEKGARIVEVFEGSEAASIGLEKGDIIIEVNKQPVDEPADLVKVLKDLDEGQEVSLVVIRNGQKKDFKAVLKPFSGPVFAFRGEDFSGDPDFDVIASPHTGQFYHNMTAPEIAGAEKKGGYLGVQVKNLGDQLQKYFEVSHGVLIEEVMKDSPAEKAGLKAGDVITAISDRKIKDPDDLVRTVNYYNPGEEVVVSYTRKGRGGEVSVALTEKPGFKWNARHWKGPHGLQIIKEGDGQRIKSDKNGDVDVLKFMDEGGNTSIDIEREILIL